MGNLKQSFSAKYTIGYNSADDAAVYELSNGKLLLQSVDFFTPIVDDPFEFGQIAAANSLSDIYAMGGKPLFALNVAAFPEDKLPIDILTEILKGGQFIANKAGIPILGGHTIKDNEIKFGMAVTGEVDKYNLKTNDNAYPGDCLVLTKPLGTGIISTAIKKNIVSRSIIEEANKVMKTLNLNSSNTMLNYEINACTDITGYGLLGHLLEMCIASDVSSEINYNNIPFIDGTKELFEQNIIPGGSKKNYDYVKTFIKSNKNITFNDELLLSDAQTSGGLLISVIEKDCDSLINEINSNNEFKAHCIGRITKKRKNIINII